MKMYVSWWWYLAEFCSIGECFRPNLWR